MGNGQSTLAKSRLASYGSELCLKFGQELYKMEFSLQFSSRLVSPSGLFSVEGKTPPHNLRH